jgi:hypothetical protein
MNQTFFDFTKERERIKKSLGRLEEIVANCLTTHPQLKELTNRNELIRTIWRDYDESIPAESITRLARKLQATGALDTTNNQTHRANYETAFNQYFNN